MGTDVVRDGFVWRKAVETKMTRVQSLKFEVHGFRIVFKLALFLIAGISSQAQGAFQNLDFEAVNVPLGTQPGASLVLPSWSPSPIPYDVISTGGAAVAITDSKTQFINFLPLQGNFSVVLFGGPDIGAAGSSSISQTGIIPANAQSIQMDIAYPAGRSFAGAFTVTLGGQQIPMQALQTSSAYVVYGGNISAYAGLIEALTITQFPPAPPTVPPSVVELDNIVFSPTAVPEPETWALILFGAVWFGVRRWNQTRK
jgi:hypothetical protein